MRNWNEEAYLKDFETLVKIDSTTGQYEKIQQKLCEMIEEIGMPYQTLHKGGIVADGGGEGDALVITAHFDDIGLMVRHINADGSLNVCPVGGLYPFNCNGENVRIESRDGSIHTGILSRIPNSIHVSEEELRNVLGDFRSNVCIILDEDVKSAEDTRKLGIETGDMVALEPRYQYVNGYIKSRFVDDKACVAILLEMMRAIQQKQLKLNRKVYFYFGAYEEIGHGTTWLPEGVRDIIAVDIAPVGPDQNSDERKVSIFAKDSRFPYHWGLTNALRETALKHEIAYVMDIFTPHYGTDADGSILAGYDIRHAGVGPGTLNSHGYERTHMDGVYQTYRLLMAYLGLE